MNTYVYSATEKRTSKIVTGTIDEESIEEAEETLKSIGFQNIKFVESAPSMHPRSNIINVIEMSFIVEHDSSIKELNNFLMKNWKIRDVYPLENRALIILEKRCVDVETVEGSR